MSDEVELETLVSAAERKLLLAQGIVPGSAAVLDRVSDEEWEAIREAGKARKKPDPEVVARLLKRQGRPEPDPRDKGKLMLFAGRQFAALPPKMARAACHAWALANTGLEEAAIAEYLDLAERRR